MGFVIHTIILGVKTDTLKFTKRLNGIKRFVDNGNNVHTQNRYLIKIKKLVLGNFFINNTVVI